MALGEIGEITYNDVIYTGTYLITINISLLLDNTTIIKRQLDHMLITKPHVYKRVIEKVTNLNPKFERMLFLTIPFLRLRLFILVEINNLIQFPKLSEINVLN